MPYFPEEKPPLEELVHFGVKGMRWGVRKDKSRDEPNSDYTLSQRTRDKREHGKGAVKRINRNMNSGLTRKEAVTKERVRRNAISDTISLGIMAASAYVMLRGPSGPLRPSGRKPFSTKINDMFRKISAKAAAQRARDVLANARGLGVDSMIFAKKNRKGAYKVTDL